MFWLFELNEDFILEGEEHIDSFINALKEGKEYLKSKQKEEISSKTIV
jgi:hypothetical protein